ncbi:MAG: autotransporter-associated beta strand repeat-containing protein [Prevotella sp.]|nr:autotransporter-associated beta strand repeat-containing protein [Prevotella sp.]
MKKLILLALFGLMSVGVSAQRVTDKLDRGIVAIPSGQGNLVSWRKFGYEYYDTQYNLYRNGTKIAGPISVSNFKDTGGNASSRYVVEPIVKGVAQAKSAEVQAWSQAYFDVPVMPVVNRAGKTIGNSTTSGASTTSGYTINDITLADVDGDGICEFIVKRNNSQGNLRTATNTTDFNLYECYKIDGRRLWWIDLGPNLMAGADEQWDMIGYDWDEDGKAEMIMRGADNMIIHTATGKTINIGSMTAGFTSSDRPEYMGVGNEYLLYLNGETGEPYDWDGSENWTPMAYPLPQFEANETKGDANVWGDLGHRMMKHYFGAPYLDGRHASIFLGRGCYTRHKMCALDVDPATHKLTQRWRWNCYDSGSAWFGNGFHNFAIADVDMDGRDEIMFGSMCIDDTGFGLSTTGLGHGDAQHCGDLDPYRWGLEQFTCQEGSEGNSYWNPTTGQIYYRKSDGGDDGRALAGNFSNDIPGGQGRSVSSGVIGLSSDKVVNTNGDAMSGSYANLNNRIYWDGDLLDEILNSAGGEGRPAAIFKWGGSRIWTSDGAVHNNSSKCNPSAQGDILGDWREEVVLRTSNNSAMRIFCTTYTTDYDIYTLWDDHVYRNGMCWQNVGYNQPPHVSFFLGELEGITIAPPPAILQGRTEVQSGATIQTTEDHLLVSGYEDHTISVADGASPWVLTVNAPAWVKGSGSQQATRSTSKTPAREVVTYTTTLTGGAFAGATRLVKQGEGVLVLPNVTERHTGETNIWNGTLQFDGTMESSPVWMNRHTTLISNGGNFKGGLKIDYNATVYPGGQENVGAITASTLNLGFGSRIVFDVNGTDIDKVNATTLVVETKTWNNGPKYKTPVFEFKNASALADGKFEIGTVNTVEGSVADILIEGISGKRFELQHEDGKLYLVIETMRAATTVLWNGTDENNIWDLATTKNFLMGEESVYAVVGDDLVFTDDAASTTVNVKGAVSPNSLTFNNETKAYSLRGDSILGGPTLVKNGAARLTITNENRLGNTTINGGTVSVNALANVTGVTYGALGSVSQTITINDAALSVSQPVITDQQVNVSGQVTLDVPTNMSFTLNKALRGNGAVITKTGAGTLTTSANNTYAKLIIKGGRVNCSGANGVDQLPATVEFQGGSLSAANDESSNIDNTANIVVEKGNTGTFYGGYRSTYRGTLTGEGTFNVYTGGVRCYYDGDWSAFSGTINVGKNNRQNKKSYDPAFMYRNSKGLPLATVNVADNVRFSNEGTGIRVKRLGGNGAVTGSGTWIVDTDENFTLTTEVGITSVRKDDYGNEIGKSTSPLTKRGMGKMTMTAGRMYGVLTVEGGTVAFNDSKLATALNGSQPTTVKNGGRIAGQGLFYSLTLQDGGELLPCGSTFSETTPGTIKSSNSINAHEGSVISFNVSAAKNSTLEVTNKMTMNGTVKLILPATYTPKKDVTFTLWTAKTFEGTPKFDLPALPDGLYWDTTGVAAATGVLRITDDASVGIGRIGADEAVVCDVYTVGGAFVGTVEAQRGTVRSAVTKLGVKPGLYVVRMAAGRNFESETVVVR